MRKQPLIDPQTKALIEAGFFRATDLLFFLIILAGGATTLAWWAFANPTLAHIALCLIGVVIVLLVWLVTLVYRASFWALQCLSEMKLLPVTAAKMALKFASQSGGAED